MFTNVTPRQCDKRRTQGELYEVVVRAFEWVDDKTRLRLDEAVVVSAFATGESTDPDQLADGMVQETMTCLQTL